MTHVFDRGAFGFQKVRCLTIDYLCCIWPVYGETVARQRCECNGPLWNRMLTDCGKFLFLDHLNARGTDHVNVRVSCSLIM
jgi:hypothetical protein